MTVRHELIHSTHVRPPDIHDIYQASELDKPTQIALHFMPKKGLLMKIMRATALTQHLRETATEDVESFLLETFLQNAAHMRFLDLSIVVHCSTCKSIALHRSKSFAMPPVISGLVRLARITPHRRRGHCEF